MRIATYNIEWMDRLFDNDGALLNGDGWSSRHKVTRKEQTDAHFFRFPFQFIRLLLDLLHLLLHLFYHF
mgnify:CR=1 FL=1